MDTPVRDFRAVGPVLECPLCQCMWFQATIAFDPETLLPGAWFTQGACYQCESLVIIPTPLDEIIREPGGNGSADDGEMGVSDDGS